MSWLLHSDLSAEHILLSADGNRVEAIIDWTDAVTGDPAHDFAGLWVWQGQPFVEQVLEHYAGAMDADFRQRIRLYALCSALSDFSYGVQAGREANRRLGLAALERSLLDYNSEGMKSLWPDA